VRRRLTVKITKAKNDVLWYRDKINEEFKVIDKGGGSSVYELKGKGHVSRIIYKEDAEEL
jgi:hypothetical protein